MLYFKFQNKEALYLFLGVDIFICLVKGYVICINTKWASAEAVLPFRARLFFVVRNYSEHYRTFGSIAGIYPVDVSSTSTTPLLWQQKCLQMFPHILGDKLSPSWELLG